MKLFILLPAILLIQKTSCDQFEIMRWKVDSPTAGPSLDSVYKPGTPGAAWTEDEIETTRYRILQAMHPDWNEKKLMYGDNVRNGNSPDGLSDISENKIMRLVFHDCAKYTDGTGGCDGCINWKGMDAKIPNVFKKSEFYSYEPIDKTDNHGLGTTAEALELIYTTTDWPFKQASLEASLQQLGKSRADLWQFAGLIALEKSLERANRACDLDKWSRQQTSLLEGRDACEFKIYSPLKFWSGRADCSSEDKDGRGFKASKDEISPRMFGDAVHITDFMLQHFGLGAEHSQALQAVHGAVHGADIGTKYTWYGAGYISNMYYKFIANKPTFKFEGGGDLSFHRGKNVQMYAQGTTDGQPFAGTGWRASCMMMWNTPEGGPCFLRPSGAGKWDSPNKELNTENCVEKVPDADGNPVIKNSQFCKNVWVNKTTNIVHGAEPSYTNTPIIGPWSEDLTRNEKQRRHNHGWSNQFAFPWEISSYWKFTTSENDGQRAIGCPGLDDPFDEWPYRNTKSPIYASFAMDCGKQDYMGLSDIVDRFATDQQYWSIRFLEAWDIMQQNGYTDLTAGPVTGWLGYYSLKKQGRQDELAPLDDNPSDTGLVWTDPKADPRICGHKGHHLQSCGFKFSEMIERNLAGENQVTGPGSGPGLD